MVGKRNNRKSLRTTHFLVVSTLVIFAVGCVTFAWQVVQRQSGSADYNTIVGQPSLPAASVDAIFSRAGSPMVGTGAVVEEAARKTNIDDAFALAVWWAETNDGMAGVGLGAHNPGGVKGSAGYPVTSGGYTAYPSYAAAVTDWFNIVKARYVNAGLTSVYTICGPYVGTATACSSGGWAGKVSSYMQRYRGMAPAPTPRPTQKPIASKPVHGTQRFDLAAAAPANKAHGPVGAPATSGSPEQRHTLLPVGEAIGIGLSLLLALAVAGWGMFLRSGLAGSGKESEPGDDDAVFAAGQLSMLADSDASTERQPVTEQFVVAGMRAAAVDQGRSRQVDEIDTQVHPALPAASRGGTVHTEQLPVQFGGLHLPTRARAAQGVPSGGGGLLRRYRGEQDAG
ncbi:MAG: glucosaminidase domain-containing protein [Ktedonobacteraceae bacterium]|nr:glucosaminidase domain-containing protein [Ktedonobacteraceae bacterium]